MRVDRLSLTNFRNYARLETALPSGALLLHGANAQGKTSLLESIYYLATAHSPWATADRQLLNWRAERDTLPFVRIAGDVTSGKPGATRTQLDITLMREQLDAEARLKKTIRVNGVPRRALDLIGAMNVVLFVPQDLALIEGSPSDRRRYLNVTLSQTDASYARALHTFDRALEQRNALLRRIQDRQAKPAELEYWDDLFSTAGGGIVAGRQRLLRELEGTAQRVHRELTDDAETLDLRYIPGFVPAADTNGQLSFEVPGLDLHRQLEPRRIADQLCEVLRNGRGAEIARGITLIGPQRDELRFRVNGRDLGLYGSRGQARTAVLALKLAELEWMRGVIGEWPILLLDEFLAELDSARRAYLLARIDGAAQVILTTTEPDIFTPEFLRKSTLWHVRAGQIV
ncbi:MAG: DNA replication/repair protein RecF [Aggregatilineales bacterium]